MFERKTSTYKSLGQSRPEHDVRLMAQTIDPKISECYTAWRPAAPEASRPRYLDRGARSWAARSEHCTMLGRFRRRHPQPQDRPSPISRAAAAWGRDPVAAHTPRNHSTGSATRRPCSRTISRTGGPCACACQCPPERSRRAPASQMNAVSLRQARKHGDATPARPPVRAARAATPAPDPHPKAPTSAPDRPIPRATRVLPSPPARP